MPSPQSLEARCDSCKISGTCPARGASPLKAGKKATMLCRIVGGYSSAPVRQDILSTESAERFAKDGPCMSLAEVPRRDPDSGHYYREVVKVFHMPILHPRQKTAMRADIMLQQAYARQPRGRGGVK